MKNTKPIKKVSLKTFCFIFFILFVNHQIQANEKTQLPLRLKMVLLLQLIYLHPIQMKYHL